MSFALTSLRSRSLLVTLFATAALAGCHDRLYDFGGTLKPLDAGTGAAGTGIPDSSVADRMDPDVPKDGPANQGTGGMGGTGGRAGAGGAAGGIVACDDKSPERQSDLANCGKCFNICIAPNSDPQCLAGQCVYTCQGGFFDADKDAKNGCECVKTNGGIESCDGFDNDCDGTVDEGFDFQGDVNNCGKCSQRCFYPFATASCALGLCKQGACLAGYYDRDPNVPGCETACAKTNGGIEICDGLDNDCNGTIDDNVAAATITCKNKGVCVGVTPTCMGQSGWVCKYPATYQELETTSMGCDTRDNDCDGFTDEPFDIGKACVVGSGPCAGTGTWACDAAAVGMHRCMGSMKTPGTEVCNGKDDDCDGKVDELDKISDSNDKTVYFAAQNVTLFVHEATRYDATATDHGFDSTRRPCSLAGKQPWTNVTKEEAEASCEKVGTGWRLCTAAEWLNACNGAGNTAFPYGAAYVANRCNGYDYTFPAAAATVATGAATMCISDLTAAAGDDMYDMSGNVKEWVITGAASTSATGPYELRGGAYNISSFIDSSVMPAVTDAPGLRCDASTPAPSVAVRLPSVGFRCCRTGQLPP